MYDVEICEGFYDWDETNQETNWDKPTPFRIDQGRSSSDVYQKEQLINHLQMNVTLHTLRGLIEDCSRN